MLRDQMWDQRRALWFVRLPEAALRGNWSVNVDAPQHGFDHLAPFAGPIPHFAIRHALSTFPAFALRCGDLQPIWPAARCRVQIRANCSRSEDVFAVRLAV